MKYALIISVAIVGFFLLSSLFGFLSAIKPPRIVSDITPNRHGLSYDKVEFTTEDDVTLRGWFIPSTNKETTKTIIGLHGYPADKGDILPVLVPLTEDFNLLLFDFRYFGESEGRYSTAGLREVQDLRAAVEYLKARGQERIGVWGLSMGGSVALMTHPHPDIHAISSYGAYSDLTRIAPELYRVPFVNHLLGQMTIWWAWLILREDVRTMRPAEAISGSSLPIMIAHSRHDEIIPFQHAEEFRDALADNEHAVFWPEDDLPHGGLSFQYRDAVRDFFLEHL